MTGQQLKNSILWRKAEAWQHIDPQDRENLLEHVRKEFRGLMQFPDNGSGSAARFYYTHFTDSILNRQQIDFVHRIISHIEQNGYMESADLMKPPFDAPYKFVQIFDGQMQKALVQTIVAVKNNAVEIAAS